MAKKLLVTPKGLAVYPHLSKPDTKFNKDGVYTTKLKLEGEPAEVLAKTIDDAMKANILKVKAELKEKGKLKGNLKVADLPYTREQVDDEATGAIIFSFKMNATGKTKAGEVFTRQPAIFDAAGQPAKGLRIGGGSTIRVSYELNPFYVPANGAGVSLRLYAVQVIELVEFGGNAGYFGFESEEQDGGTETAPAAGKTSADDEPETADDF